MQLLTADETLRAAALAGHTEIVRAVLEAGPEIDAGADSGLTALMEAAFAGQVDTVRMLLQRPGTEVNARLDDGSTALRAAALAGHTEIVRVLLEAGAELNARANNGLTALMEAAFAGHVKTVRMLLRPGAEVNARLDDGSTALMAAALAGHTEIVRALLEAGAEVDLTADNDATALTEASYPGHLDIVRMLLAAGAEVDTGLDTGWTALLAAVLGSHDDLVRMLLDAGADVNARNSMDWTPLMQAAASADMTMVETLLAGGADVSAHERGILVGSAHINEYYASNAASLLDLATAEFQPLLDDDPEDLAALEWMGAVEVFRWDEDLDVTQFRKANSMLQQRVTLDPDQPEAHYWLAATSWIFAFRGAGASAAEQAAIIDEGIEHAQRAVELDPQLADAVVYLSLLYRQKAERAGTAAERDRLGSIADAVYQDSLTLREEAGPRPFRPGDFFRPVAPPSPAPPFDDGFPFGIPQHEPADANPTLNGRTQR